MEKALARIFPCLAVLLLAGGFALPARAACTVSTSNDCHIGSAGLEINLGPLPIDHYGDHNNNNGTLHGSDAGWIPTHNCATSKSVRKCIIDILKDYKAQGVTGVRFQFALGAPGLSTAFDTNGNVNRKWLNNLQLFFSDLARNVGIKNISPTPVISDHWSASSAYYVVKTVTSCSVSKQLRFIKWLPYGLRTDNLFPDCQGNNFAYDVADGNTGTTSGVSDFWGWDKFYNLMDAVLSRAAAQGLNVSDLDLQNEVDLFNFTVQARLIYDRTRGEDVLGKIRAKMVTYFGTGADLRVTYSSTLSPPGTDGEDCGSVYGDTALIITLSEMTAATDVGWIGIPEETVSGPAGLACGGKVESDAGVDYMVDLSEFYSAYSQPVVHNIHVYVPGDATARNFYDGMWNYLDYRGFTSHKAMIGEANPVPTTTCDTFDPAKAYSSVNGYNGYTDSKPITQCRDHASSSSTSSCLYQYANTSTVLRPWQNNQNENTCWTIPTDITPPYSP